MSELSADDLVDERNALADLVFVDTVGGTASAPGHRYRFPGQETDLRDGKTLMSMGGEKLGKLETISFEDRIVDIKKRMASVDRHPPAVFFHELLSTQILSESLVGIGEYVVMNDVEDDGAHSVARSVAETAAACPWRAPAK